MGRRSVKIGEEGWRTCNGKMWNNMEKMSKKGRGIVGRKVTVWWERRRAKNKWDEGLKKD